jgi:restriction system protein
MIYLQAKCSTNKTVGRPDIQAFAWSLVDMHRAKKGVFITTSGFSKDALEYVGLIDKITGCEFWSNEVRLKDEMPWMA